MTRPRLLDLFCGDGGASVGYHRAGFDVVGVDLAPKRQYPFEFHLANALTFPLDGYDAIHASPPCQAFSVTRSGEGGRNRLFDPYPDLVDPIRQRLIGAGIPYVIENVPGAPLIDPITLCGTSFGLELVRHRTFECGAWKPPTPPPCRQCRNAVRDGRAISVFGHGGGVPRKGRSTQRFDDMGIVDSYRRALGIDHMTDRRSLAEAIPPAYTEWIGRHLLAALPHAQDRHARIPAGIDPPALIVGQRGDIVHPTDPTGHPPRLLAESQPLIERHPDHSTGDR